MATGDVQDIINRLRSVMPPWFPSNGPVVTALLTGLATSGSFIYGYIQFMRTQSRIATASGGFLDLIANDYFGTNFLRRAAEPDSVYRARILKELLRPRVTLAALTQMLI